MGKKKRSAAAEKKARNAAMATQSAETRAAAATADTDAAIVKESLARLQAGVRQGEMPSLSNREVQLLTPRLNALAAKRGGAEGAEAAELVDLLNSFNDAVDGNNPEGVRAASERLLARQPPHALRYTRELQRCIEEGDVLGMSRIFGEMAAVPRESHHEMVLEMLARFAAREKGPRPTAGELAARSEDVGWPSPYPPLHLREDKFAEHLRWLASLSAARVERLVLATLRIPPDARGVDFYHYYCCHLAKTVARGGGRDDALDQNWHVSQISLGAAGKSARAADDREPSLCRRRCAPLRYKLHAALPALLRIAGTAPLVVRAEALSAATAMLAQPPERSLYDDRGGPVDLVRDALGAGFDVGGAVASAIRCAVSLLGADGAAWTAELETPNGRHQADIVSRGAWSAAGAAARGADVATCLKREAAVRLWELVARVVNENDAATIRAAAEALREERAAAKFATLARDPAADAATLAFCGRTVHDMSHCPPLAAVFADTAFVDALFELLKTPRAASIFGAAEAMEHLRRPTPDERAAEAANGGGGCGPKDAAPWFEKAVLERVLELAPLEPALRASLDFKAGNPWTCDGDPRALALDAPAPWFDAVWSAIERASILGTKAPTDCGDEVVEVFSRHMVRAASKYEITTASHATKFLQAVCGVCVAADRDPRAASRPRAVAPLCVESELRVDDFAAAGVDVAAMWSGASVVRQPSMESIEAALARGGDGLSFLSGGSVGVHSFSDKAPSREPKPLFRDRDGTAHDSATFERNRRRGVAFVGAGVNGGGRARAAADALASLEAARAARPRRTRVSLDVSLVGVAPRVWRRVAGVKSNTPLSVLHDKIIAPALGHGRAQHAYVFEPWAARAPGAGGRVVYGAPDAATADVLWLDADCPDPFFAGCVVVDAARVCLSDVLDDGATRLKYWYDLGERLLYEVALVDDGEGAASHAAPTVVDGARFCPPENVGLPTYCELTRKIARGPRRDATAFGGFWENTYGFWTFADEHSLVPPGRHRGRPPREADWSVADAQARVDALAGDDVASLAKATTATFDSAGRATHVPRVVRGRCAVCGNAPKEGSKLLRCARCRNVSYCTPECQRAHWPRHKPVCVD